MPANIDAGYLRRPARVTGSVPADLPMWAWRRRDGDLLRCRTGSLARADSACAHRASGVTDSARAFVAMPSSAHPFAAGLSWDTATSAPESRNARPGASLTGADPTRGEIGRILCGDARAEHPISVNMAAPRASGRPSTRVIAHLSPLDVAPWRPQQERDFPWQKTGTSR